jgi:hypothetical protein
MLPFPNQSFSHYGLFQNPGLHTRFGLTLNRGLDKSHVFASKPCFTQRALLHKTVFYTNTMSYPKNNGLAGSVQALFAACRVALSMVAGGTRRRWLNLGRSQASSKETTKIRKDKEKQYF